MLELPLVMTVWIWLVIILGYVGIVRVFATKPNIQSVNLQKFNGIVGFIFAFILMVYMLGWAQ